MKKKPKVSAITPENIRTAISKSIGDLIMQHEPDMMGQNQILVGVKQHIINTRKARLSKLNTEQGLIGASIESSTL